MISTSAQVADRPLIEMYVFQTRNPQQTGKQRWLVSNLTPNRKVNDVIIWVMFGQTGVLDPEHLYYQLLPHSRSEQHMGQVG